MSEALLTHFLGSIAYTSGRFRKRRGVAAGGLQGALAAVAGDGSSLGLEEMKQIETVELLKSDVNRHEFASGGDGKRSKIGIHP